MGYLKESFDLTKTEFDTFVSKSSMKWQKKHIKMISSYEGSYATKTNNKKLRLNTTLS